MLERLKRPAETYDRLVRRLVEAASHGGVVNVGLGTASGPEPGMGPEPSDPMPTRPLEPTHPRYGAAPGPGEGERLPPPPTVRSALPGGAPPRERPAQGKA